MAIDPYWKTAEAFSSIEIAYLTCGEEPENLNQSRQKAPQKVVNVYQSIWRFCVDQGMATEHEKFYKRLFLRQTALEIIDRFKAPEQPNILKEPDEKQLNDSELDKIATENGNNPDSKNGNHGTRQQRCDEILEAIKSLGIEKKDIPPGALGKQKIKDQCLKNAGLFTGSTFERAWSHLSKTGQISIRNKENYIKNR